MNTTIKIIYNKLLLMRLLVIVLAWAALTCNVAWGAVVSPGSPASLAYVLQAEKLGSSRADAVSKIKMSGRDWIIIDSTYDSKNSRWSREEIRHIAEGKPGRKVIAYFSIGEAEDYRSYWNREWDSDRDGKPDKNAPQWLDKSNPDWKGNYKAQYWKSDWQRILLKELDKIIEQGFDGVYLDIIDAFEFFEYEPAEKKWISNRINNDTGKSYRQDMIDLVTRISVAARKRNSGFLVVPQNGYQLLSDSKYLRVISAIGIEDMFTNNNGLQRKSYSKSVQSYLRKAKVARKPVLLIEYTGNSVLQSISIKKALENGYILLLTDRKLQTLGRSSLW